MVLMSTSQMMKSSARSAMLLAQTVLALSKLRQEQHGNERPKQRRGSALSSKPTAPDGAGVVFDGSSSKNRALLAELSWSLIPFRTARARNPAVSSVALIAPSRTRRRGQPLQSEARNAKNVPANTMCGGCGIARRLQAVCFGWSQFPVPEARLAGQVGPTTVCRLAWVGEGTGPPGTEFLRSTRGF